MMLRTAAAVAALLAWAPLAAVAQTAPLTVTVNGTAVAFDQPPVERHGRVYVPLRGVFEQLGASVVYDGRKIEATSGATTVALQIGSNNALVNGALVGLDSPPFLIGARTLVPLRFVAQALGASVSYDGSTRTVAIVRAGAATPVVITPIPQVSAALVRMEPAPNTTVRGVRPQISATFSRAIDPNTVHLRLDGRDITSSAYVSTRAFSYEPAYDLPFGPHQVAVTANGLAQSWSFVNAPQPSTNTLRGVLPPNGAVVANTFTVRGFTRPGSRVHIIATASALVGFATINENTVTADAGADANGYFARTISVFDVGAGVIDARIESRAPDGAVAVRTLRLRPR
jgi:copper amine oxidase-like protein